MRASDSIYDERWPMQDVLLPYAYRLSVYGSYNRFIVRRGSITGHTTWLAQPQTASLHYLH